MMRRIVTAAVLALLVAVPSAAHATGLDETCELTATRFDPDTVNVLFPDSSAQYWTASYRAVPGTHIRIDGVYPYARYTSWNVYDPLLRPFAHRADIDLAPAPGTARAHLAQVHEPVPGRRRPAVRQPLRRQRARQRPEPVQQLRLRRLPVEHGQRLRLRGDQPRLRQAALDPRQGAHLRHRP
jgi:hypothetical protein